MINVKKMLFMSNTTTGDQPVPLVIGAVASTTAKILSTIVAPLSVPVVSIFFKHFN